MDPRREELAELVERAASLRATVARLESDLAAVTAEQATIAARLRALGAADGGDDDLKTRVDGLEADETEPSLQIDRKGKDHAALKAGAVGAGLTIGLVIIVLLAMNLASSRSSEGGAATAGPAASAVAAAMASAGPLATVAERDEIPPPPPPSTATSSETTPPVAVAPATSAAGTTAAAAPSASPAVTAPPAALGALTVVCTPKCDSVLDNNVSIAPGSAVNVPVPAGSHRLVLSAPNGVKKTVVVNVVPGQTREVHVAMDQAVARDYGF